MVTGGGGGGGRVFLIMLDNSPISKITVSTHKQLAIVSFLELITAWIVFGTTFAKKFFN